MDFDARIQSIFDASDAGAIHFGEVIGQLFEAQIESYAVDYRSARIVCFRRDDRVVELHVPQQSVTIAENFDTDALKAAIKGAQEGRVKFPEFKALSQAAGCIGYSVWILGHHVTYFGRRGEVHTEPFPD